MPSPLCRDDFLHSERAELTPSMIPYLRERPRRLLYHVLARRRRRRLRRARTDHPKLRRPRRVKNAMVQQRQPPSDNFTQ